MQVTVEYHAKELMGIDLRRALPRDADKGKLAAPSQQARQRIDGLFAARAIYRKAELTLQLSKLPCGSI